MNTPNLQPVVCIVHTSFVSVTQLAALFAELAPQAKVRNIVDDTLLPEVLANGGVTPHVRSRMCEYYKAAELAGADLIFNQCSSVGEVADIAATLVRVPVIKVDTRMAEVACKTGPRIGVVATLETTLGPTCRLISTLGGRRSGDPQPHGARRHSRPEPPYRRYRVCSGKHDGDCAGAGRNAGAGADEPAAWRPSGSRMAPADGPDRDPAEQFALNRRFGQNGTYGCATVLGQVAPRLHDLARR
jgi:hypothetical protein